MRSSYATLYQLLSHSRYVIYGIEGGAEWACLETAIRRFSADSVPAVSAKEELTLPRQMLSASVTVGLIIPLDGHLTSGAGGITACAALTHLHGDPVVDRSQQTCADLPPEKGDFLICHIRQEVVNAPGHLVHGFGPDILQFRFCPADFRTAWGASECISNTSHNSFRFCHDHHLPSCPSYRKRLIM